jgi:branched-chain amino acid aminotransferase
MSEDTDPDGTDATPVTATGRDDLGDRTVVAVGEPGAPETATVGPPESVGLSVLDRGFLYGDAGFETLRCYDGRPAHLDRHAERLRETLAALSIPHEPTAADLRAWVDRLLRALDDGDGERASEHAGDAYVRYSVTRGDRVGVLSPTETTPRAVAVATPLSKRRYEPATVETVGQRRHDAALYRLKTHNYLPGVLARGAVGTDADEALLLAADGSVASGASSNVFVLRESGLYTPTGPIRQGVTREVVLSVAASLGVETHVGPVEPAALTDDAVSGVFLTNSTWGVRPVATVDGRSVPRSDTVETIAERYLDGVLG